MGANVMLSFMPDWWVKALGRDDFYKAPLALEEEMKLAAAKEKILFKKFGKFSQGAENPKLLPPPITGPGDVVIPAVMGAGLFYSEGTWWCKPKNFSSADWAQFKAGDFENHPVVLDMKRCIEDYKKRGWKVNGFINWGSITNAAVRFAGDSFFLLLITDADIARRVCDEIFKIILDAIRFCRREFGPLEANGLGNCTVSMLGPEKYQKLILPFDIKIAALTEEVTDSRKIFNIHHCLNIVDDYLDAYGEIPGLTAIQASADSDIELFKKKLPGVSFEPILDPKEIARSSPAELKMRIKKLIDTGATKIYATEITSDTPDENVVSILEAAQ